MTPSSCGNVAHTTATPAQTRPWLSLVLQRSLGHSILLASLSFVLLPSAAGANENTAADTTERLGDPSKLARAVDDGDFVDKLPEELRNVEVEESVGVTVPLTGQFRDDGGQSVTLQQYLDGELPVILTFNYSNCPMLCSLQLDALVKSMAKIQLQAGLHYQIVTVGLDPTETPEVAAETKARYLRYFPEDQRERVAGAWHFLVGDEAPVREVADAVGFRYKYLERTKEYVHPASLIFLSPQGVVTRYFHGIHYIPEQLNEAIFTAGIGEHGVSMGFVLACLKYQPDANDYSKGSREVMRYGGAVFLALVFGGLGLMRYRRRRRLQRAASQKIPTKYSESDYERDDT